jgi:uncharacterized membrane protein YhiD involved in acid resistance
MDQIPDALQITVFIILGVAGLAYLFSLVRRDSHRETKDLADTRGERIDDLEETVARLKMKMAKLEDYLSAYQSIKHEEIAVEVARLLEPRLPRREDS